MATEGPEQDLLKQGHLFLGLWAILFVVCSMELLMGKNGLTEFSVAILSLSREADRSHNYEVSSSLEIVFVSQNRLPPVIWHNWPWTGPLE